MTMTTTKPKTKAKKQPKKVSPQPTTTPPDPPHEKVVALTQFQRGLHFGYTSWYSNEDDMIKSVMYETDDFQRGVRIGFVAQQKLLNAERKRLGLPLVKVKAKVK